MRNKSPNICVLQGPIYTGAKIMRVHALKCAYMRVSQITLYMLAREVPFDFMAVCVIYRFSQA